MDKVESSSSSSSIPVPTLIQIRVGKCQPPEFYEERLGSGTWPSDISSAYWKDVVEEVEVTAEGLAGNEIGHPSHLAESKSRAAMVYNLLNNKLFKERFPEHEIGEGDFGENFIVDHPLLLSSEVCVGDVYQIGSAVFSVTGPRRPCPKVDASQKLKGIQTVGLQNGWSGFFFRVEQPGRCKAGDEIRLLARPHPGYSIQRIAQGIWGPPEKQENSREFLEALANMEELLCKGYKDTAQTRLARLDVESR